MNRKLLFFDIDGTLLAGNYNGYIPEKVIEALIEAKKNGHLLFINSGRSIGMLPDIVMEFPFDGYLCGCGTQIILNGETVYHHRLEKDLRDEIPNWFIQSGVQGVFEGPDYCYFSKDEEHMFPAIRHFLDYNKHIVGMDRIRSYPGEEVEFSKFIVLAENEDQVSRFKALSAKHFDYIERERMGDYYFGEIIPCHHSKASAMDFICDYYQLSLDDCYAFGDSTNDLSMLSHVKNSIGMGNSAPEVLEQVSYITTPVNRDGIAIALKHFGLI